MFEPIAGGAYFARLTEKARPLGPDQMARAAFARLMQEKAIDPDVVYMGWYGLAVVASTTTDPDCVTVDASAPWTLAVRVTDSFVVIHGLTYRARWEALIEKYGPLVPTTQLLSISEWLLSFPHLWAATPEEDACTSRTTTTLRQQHSDGLVAAGSGNSASRLGT